MARQMRLPACATSATWATSRPMRRESSTKRCAIPCSAVTRPSSARSSSRTRARTICRRNRTAARDSLSAAESSRRRAKTSSAAPRRKTAACDARGGSSVAGLAVLGATVVACRVDAAEQPRKTEARRGARLDFVAHGDHPLFVVRILSRKLGLELLPECRLDRAAAIRPDSEFQPQKFLSRVEPLAPYDRRLARAEAWELARERAHRPHGGGLHALARRRIAEQRHVDEAADVAA